jgi:hypothetical protein
MASTAIAGRMNFQDHIPALPPLLLPVLSPAKCYQEGRDERSSEEHPEYRFPDFGAEAGRRVLAKLSESLEDLDDHPGDV